MNARTLIGTSILLSVSLLIWPQAPQTSATVAAVESTLAPGVQYRHIKSKTPAGDPWSIHVLEVNRSERRTKIRAAAGVHPASPPEMARELPTQIGISEMLQGHRIVGVVNGDYDAMPYLGVSVGPSVTSNHLWTAGGKNSWPALAIGSDGSIAMGTPRFEGQLQGRSVKLQIRSFNRPPSLNAGLALYSREFRSSIDPPKPVRAITLRKTSPDLPMRLGTQFSAVITDNRVTALEVSIPSDGLVLIVPGADSGEAASLARLAPGQEVRLELHLWVGKLRDPAQVVGGFPVIVRRGRKEIVGKVAESHAKRHPRTAICYNQASTIFAVVDGRQPALSVGMTLDELADLMVSLGCGEAINTDGGGSSVMAVAKSASEPRLRIVNSPSDGKERGRGNAWVIESTATVH